MKTDAEAFCEMVTNEPDISNAAARFGAWLIGAAEQTGGFPIELTMHQIRLGFDRKDVHVQGMGGRYETIGASIAWLQERGHLAVSEGRPVGFGYTAKNYTITL